ncbi:MAG: TIGR04283 family arsenosugar biosynthesis glycosyltransferase [Vicinamibacterales bacterium]
MTRVSAIVPVLNEASRVGPLVQSLLRMGIHEVIVVDGGSTDGTADHARSTGQCQVLAAPRGRASQMNAGARVATGTVLWFVHADSQPPPDALVLIDEVMSGGDVVAGAFHILTVADTPGWPARWLRLANVRSYYTRLPYGDQAIFVRRDTFEQIGGFPVQPLFEDLELSRRLRRMGRIQTVPRTVIVSGRRFMARPFYYAFLMNLLPLLYRAGVPASMLARTYRAVR